MQTQLLTDAPARGSEIVFLLYPAYGHMTPALPVVAALVERGHRVTCFTSGHFAEKVRETGARVAIYDTDLCTSAADAASAEEVSRAPLRLLTETMATVPAIQRQVATRPDLIVYDTTLWAPGRLMAHAWKVPTVQLSATVASNQHFSLTRESQRYTAQIDLDHPAITEFPVRLRGYLETHGFDDIDLEDFFVGGNEFTIVFVPRQFQPAGETFNHTYSFVGPTVGWFQRKAREWRPPSAASRTVLITLGTTVNNRPDFFRTCVQAFAKTPWHVVLTLGNRFDLAELGALPPNIEAHSWIPHTQVLPHASLLICQGGMGSVMEALYFGVPVVSVPHHPEQHINARRLAELGLGRTLDRNAVTAQALREVLTLADDAELRTQAHEMKRALRNAGGAQRAADDIESLLSIWSRPTLSGAGYGHV